MVFFVASTVGARIRPSPCRSCPCRPASGEGPWRRTHRVRSRSSCGESGRAERAPPSCFRDIAFWRTGQPISAMCVDSRCQQAVVRRGIARDRRTHHGGGERSGVHRHRIMTQSGEHHGTAVGADVAIIATGFSDADVRSTDGVDERSVVERVGDARFRGFVVLLERGAATRASARRSSSRTGRVP